MSKDSLFSMLTRAPWWVSVVIAAALFAAIRLLLPEIAAFFAALPFLVIAGYTGWHQWRTPSATRVDDTLGKLRAMSWENFSAVINEAFRRDGYRVIEIFKGAVDLQVDKKGRVAIVSCKRWKVAQTGIGPLRELLAAKPALDAQDCIYVTTGAFTAKARAYATEKNIQLISDAALAELVARVERSKRGWFRRARSSSAQPPYQRLGEVSRPNASGARNAQCKISGRVRSLLRIPKIRRALEPRQKIRVGRRGLVLRMKSDVVGDPANIHQAPVAICIPDSRRFTRRCDTVAEARILCGERGTPVEHTPIDSSTKVIDRVTRRFHVKERKQPARHVTAVDPIAADRMDRQHRRHSCKRTARELRMRAEIIAHARIALPGSDQGTETRTHHIDLPQRPQTNAHTFGGQLGNAIQRHWRHR